MYVHAFSPREIWQGASTLGIPIESFLSELKEAGLGSLPGTAAEILDDEVRAIICPGKITTAQWLEVVETAHTLGVKTTATITAKVRLLEVRPVEERPVELRPA
jgi:FO synthase